MGLSCFVVVALRPMRARTFRFVLGLTTALFLCAKSANLEIYWIDVEGGAATLIVSPSGQSLLVDTGNPSPTDRDAKRIFETAQAAGLKQIDGLITTHYHGDHVGGLVALSKLIPIQKFYDHGDSAEAAMNPRAAKLWEGYQAVVSGKRRVVKPGDKVPLKGVEVEVVSSNGEVIASPLQKNAGANSLCETTIHKEADKTQPENWLSVGTLLTFGKFKFLNLGDLTWDNELMLACPVNKIGTVTLFQATHHGFYNEWSGPPALVWALKPQVVIVANGPTKGLPAGAYETLMKIPGLEGIWQGHRATKNDEAHNTSEEMIANQQTTQTETAAHWIRASVSKDGKFVVTNGRNNFSKTYIAR
jgi:competence protein ComEC